MVIPLLAAGDWFEVLAAVIVFVITGLAQWAQSRSKKKTGPVADASGETDAAPPPWGSTPRPAAGDSPSAPNPFDLEEQLRRILNPEPPTLPPPPPLAPPPLPRASERRPVAVDEESESWESAEAPSRRLASLDEADSAYQRGAGVESSAARKLSAASDLSRATSAFRHASELGLTVGSRLRGALDKTTEPAPSTARTLGSPTSAGARALSDVFRNRGSLRAAIFASTSLGRPKALEHEPER
ncbi:MAG: hypothetical protein JNL97_01855 [Verrucomicrobiales bacterium]|nr:hypothetical protein [Verrucomicrobiales bacterium]